jgi:serine protease Do
MLSWPLLASNDLSICSKLYRLTRESIMQAKTTARSLIAGGLIIALAAGFYEAGMRFPLDVHAIAPSPPAPAILAPSPALALPDFSSLVEKYGPAVVNISVTQDVKLSDVLSQIPGFDENDPLWELFRRFGGQMPRDRVPIRGLGSGLIVRPDGVILTSAHVVEDASTVTVKLTDKREFEAKVIGVDRPSDIAVIKINAKSLPSVKFGNAADVKVGEWVAAVGSPFGFENSVTAGIVSAKSRALPDALYPFIQTDVPVNPGNSGGPLFNMKGEVIGINSQIYTRTGGFQALSFAIPIDIAAKVEEELLHHGKVTRGWLGVTIQEVDQALADSFGLKHAGGALVSSVGKGSPAEKAGLQPGDVIVKLNGREIASSDLPAQVADLKPGTAAKLTLMRNGSTQEITVSVGELTESKVASTDSGARENSRLGLVVRPLKPEEQKGAGVSGGLLVEEVSGPAARAGILPGDMILSFNSTPIQSVKQLRSLAANAGKHVALFVRRDGAVMFVPINLG